MGRAEAEAGWLKQTSAEDYYFEIRPEARELRRPVTGMAALASLKFGGYLDFDGRWVQDDRVVWLAMIVSEHPGAGSTLLGQIQRMCFRHSLALAGEPIPLKPANWDVDRRWMHSEEELIHWYLQNQFRVVQNQSATRVWSMPPGLKLSVGVGLE